MKNSQWIPISLAFIVFLILWGLLYLQVLLINTIFPNNIISTQIRVEDILIGFTIYVKTAIDFAIFIGRLMDKNNSLKSRIAIEIGTAVGNAAGTMLILLVWVFLKEVPILLALMIFIASLVLLELGESGLEHMTSIKNHKYMSFLYNILERFFHITGMIYKPILTKIMPDISSKMKGTKAMAFWSLFLFSISIPFILGLDDFAGYVSLFTVINIYGFAIGVFAGHMILNIALFASPKNTIRFVKNKWVSLIGTVVFVVLAIIGFIEVGKIVVELFHN